VAHPGAKRPRPATLDGVRADPADELEAEVRERAARFQVSVGHAGDLALKDVATELGITAVQTDRIQDLCRQEGEQQLEAVFGPQDAGAIRRRIADAQQGPVEKAELQDELLRNPMTSRPRIRRAEEAKNAALMKPLGTALDTTFRTRPVHEGEVDEFDALLESVPGTTEPESGTASRQRRGTGNGSIAIVAVPCHGTRGSPNGGPQECRTREECAALAGDPCPATGTDS
jgi:hypothetical protein